MHVGFRVLYVSDARNKNLEYCAANVSFINLVCNAFEVKSNIFYIARGFLQKNTKNKFTAIYMIRTQGLTVRKAFNYTC